MRLKLTSENFKANIQTERLTDSIKLLSRTGAGDRA